MRTKTIIAGFALVVTSSQAMATQPYLGAQAGWQDLGIKYTERETGFPNLVTDGYSASGLAFGVVGGIRLPTDTGYVAVEFNYGVSGSEYEFSFDGDKDTLETKSSYGLSLIGGLKIQPKSFIYGRLGYQTTELEGTISVPGWSLSQKETHNGPRVGLGAEFETGNNVLLRLDWSRTFYSGENYFSEPGFSIELKPTESLFQVGAIVTF